ncbi:MAG: hypothetical protein NZZ41_03200 [Candidatus Dojkabacteria bacterium]|nr:hypothetical protein [Candidatus Dojkabacteria bacterium]
MADGLIDKPYIYVELNNKDVSTYITPYLTRFTYTDNDGLNKDEVDDIEIEFEDSQDIFKNNPPSRGSSIKVKFGYQDLIQSSGIFFIDSYSYKNSRKGFLFTIKALATDVKASYRTIKTTAFENTSIKSIAEKIAKDNNYKLDFIGQNISFNRITQQEKRDLQFLHFLCSNYGYTCKVSNKKIIIRNIQEVLKQSNVYILKRNNIIDFEFEASSLFDSNIEVSYLDPDKKELTKDKINTNVKHSGNTKKKNIRVENQNQANMLAKAQKTISELKEVKAKILIEGNPNVYSTCNIGISGFGAFDRVYYIACAKHIISREGYTTELDIYRNPYDTVKENQK